MMNRSVQHGRMQDAMREERQDAEQTQRVVDGRLNRRWLQRVNLAETYRTPSHFTWRC